MLQNDFLDDIHETKWGGQGRVFQLVTPGDRALSTKIDHNTGKRADNAFSTIGFTNHVVPKGEYGALGSGQGEGTSALDTFLLNYTFVKNAIVGGHEGEYPADNFFPKRSRTSASRIAQRATGRSRARARGSDGKDLGADMAAVTGATSCVAP